MKFKITREDIQASKVLTPTWYVCRINKVETGVTSKSSGALMDVFHISVAADPSNPKLKDGSDATGVPVGAVYISEAAKIGYSLPFLSAISGKQLKEGDELDSEMFHNALDKKIRVFVGNKEYNGKISNEAKDFKTL